MPDFNMNITVPDEAFTLDRPAFDADIRFGLKQQAEALHYQVMREYDRRRTLPAKEES